MGNCNCIESLRLSYYEQEEKVVQQQGRGGEEEQKPGGFEKEGGFEKGGFRVKILVSKEELDWIMLQVKEKGGKRLEDVLVEIEKSRVREKVKGQGWRPSLESIMESPEVQTLELSR